MSVTETDARFTMKKTTQSLQRTVTSTLKCAVSLLESKLQI